MGNDESCCQSTTNDLRTENTYTFKSNIKEPDIRFRTNLPSMKKVERMHTLSKAALESYNAKRGFLSYFSKPKDKHGTGPFSFGEDTTYTGSVSNMCRHGYGEMVNSDGGGYFGEWELDKKHGKGLLLFPNGDYYLGEFKYDKISGSGEYRSEADFSLTIGSFRNGLRHGQCDITYKDGAKYSGGMNRGEKDIYGKFSFPDGTVYTGEFKNGKINGKGILTKETGYKYTGWFKDGKKNGYGVENSPDGSSYKGGYLDGKKSGNGVMQWY